MIFLGTYKHTLDNKNRLTLPSKFITKLPKNIYLSRGFDGCLEIRTLEEFTKRYEYLNQYSENKRDSRNAARIYFANSHDVEIDNAKRILIPTELITTANLTKNVVIIGVGNKIEIWDETQYFKFQKQTTPMYEAIAERLDEQNK
ncbi:MAG: division/cell wall cluster transcriptional repressor MraZ [Mycoplasmataceae bacterium]|jgi:MraZ protein|nr:division/cell wall cluster transcriptional repressor MraZ [Mycoplasmataceae bacterium]